MNVALDYFLKTFTNVDQLDWWRLIPCTNADRMDVLMRHGPRYGHVFIYSTMLDDYISLSKSVNRQVSLLLGKKQWSNYPKVEL